MNATKQPSLTLRDKLSRLTLRDAEKLLGPEGRSLIVQGSKSFAIDVEEVHLDDTECCVELGGATVTITLRDDARQRLAYRCTPCTTPCQHAGALFSLILEEKTGLGLAAPPPPPRVPAESLGEGALVERALADRAERARTEKMTIAARDSEKPWTDYTVTNRNSGKSYRVALRGLDTGDSYCTCPDFRTNTLGTCKHILHVLTKVRRRFSAAELKKRYRRKHLGLHLHYGHDVTLRLLTPDKVDDEVAKLIAPLRDVPIEDIRDLLKRLSKLQTLGRDVIVYPDAEEFIQQRLLLERLRADTVEIRKDPANHPLRDSLLKATLLPYQLDGIAFAVGTGRAVLADDMGLGKTIQGVGVAEYLARHAGIKKVLVVCPTSLKSQWRNEIHRFCDRDVQLVAGSANERIIQYAADCFFTVCNYEQVLRDVKDIEIVPWDLIILDEGQRIKNWEAKTSVTIKQLRSKFALVLSGTPLENRLDDLYSVIQFVDDRRLGPGFRFFNKHRVVDENGRMLGYKNLGELRALLAPVLLRRTRDSVKLDLPERTVEFVRIPPSQEQLDIHRGHMQIVASVVRKPYISEMDLLRLQKALLMCRMVANSTVLVDKEPPGFSTKLAHLDDLFEQLFAEDGRKVVLFSEWTGMLDLIQPLLDKRDLAYVRLDGSVPQKRRPELVERFQTDANCRLFLTTNAGSTGLNLQSANTVINVDLPWNPAVLEQRIARAHRMGQVQPVQVYVLVTEETIEENLLGTIAAKRDLALAALDSESTVEEVGLASGMQELKGRLEILLGAKPAAPADESVERETVATAKHLGERRERVASAGGELLGAAFKFLGELVGGTQAAPPAVVAQIREGLDACTETTPTGEVQLTVKLSDPTALHGLAEALAKLLAASGNSSAA